MKTRILVGALFLAGFVGARADLTVVQKVEGMGQEMENTAAFKAGKTRIDTSPGTSLIMDLKTGEMINLMHAPKKYFRISGAMSQAAIEGLKQGRPASAEARPALAPTSKKDTISGYTADEYTGTVAGVKLTLWLTRALPDYETALREMSGALSQGPMGPLMQSYGIDMANLPGFPVRTVLELQPGQTMTRTVVSVSTRPLADSVFDVPAGYTEIESPVLTPLPAAAKPSPVPSR